MSARHRIVVDCESSGLRSEDIAVEVAWHDLSTGEGSCFVPAHDDTWVLEFGEERALEINGYRDRLANAVQDDGTEARRLFNALDGNTLVGANPSADAAWLEEMFVRCIDLDDVTTPPRPWAPWYHRMLDVEVLAFGVLGLDEVPGLWTVCQELGIEPGDHTAQGDVDATTACLIALLNLRSYRAVVPA